MNTKTLRQFQRIINQANGVKHVYECGDLKHLPTTLKCLEEMVQEVSKMVEQEKKESIDVNSQQS